MKPATDEELSAVWNPCRNYPDGLRAVYNLGVEHGRQRAAEERPLWPSPITDRPPTQADHDDTGFIQYLDGEGLWRVGLCNELSPWEGEGWQRTNRWKPKNPTLNELALADLEAVSKAYPGLHWDNIRCALEALQ